MEASVLTYFNILYQHFDGITEGNYDSRSGDLDSKLGSLKYEERVLATLPRRWVPNYLKTNNLYNYCYCILHVFFCYSLEEEVFFF